MGKLGAVAGGSGIWREDEAGSMAGPVASRPRGARRPASLSPVPLHACACSTCVFLHSQVCGALNAVCLTEGDVAGGASNA